MARTSGFGDRMKAMLTGDAIKDRFRQMMIAANPRSQAEAEQAAERIKKQLLEDAKSRVLSEGGGTSRKAVIDTLIEDKLKLQAAKKLDIKITDKEVEETLAQRVGATAEAAAPSAPAGSGSNSSSDTSADTKGSHKRGRSGGQTAESSGTGDQAARDKGENKPSKNPKLEEFYVQFENDGINRKTIREIFRVQLAWRDVIRKQYGPRIASLMAAMPATDEKPADSDIQFDVRVLRLTVANSDEKAVSQRMIEAENLKEKFTSCAELPKEAKLISDATVRSVERAKIGSFPKDVQPLILKASEGQMTPPVLVGGAIESYAICRKMVAMKAKTPAEQKPDPRAQEFERFSRRYLQELKRSASIDYRGS
jgi:peptidyl-prolyl cis-trans isomerase SurA